MRKVIFSIDNWYDVHTNAKFMRHIDTLDAMGKLGSPMVLMIGAYKGEMEQSFLMDYDDFTAYVLNSGYVSNQEAVLLVSGERRMSTELHYLRTYAFDHVGYLVEVAQEQAFKYDGWTYRPDVNRYWILED